MKTALAPVIAAVAFAAGWIVHSSAVKPPPPDAPAERIYIAGTTADGKPIQETFAVVRHGNPADSADIVEGNWRVVLTRRGRTTFLEGTPVTPSP